MCEFCENNRTEIDIYSDDEQKFFIRRMSDGKYYMFYRHKDFLGARGVEISNCPMCGRKLNDDEESKTTEKLLEEFKYRFTPEELEEIKELSEVFVRGFRKLWDKICGRNRLTNKDIENMKDSIDELAAKLKSAEYENACLEKDLKTAKNKWISQVSVNEDLQEGRNRLMEKTEELERVIKELESELEVKEILLKIKNRLCVTEENVCDVLPAEPIELAELLINASYTREKGDVEKALHRSFGNNSDTVTENMYSVDELRQVSEHLLVYCNHNAEEME